MGWSQTGNTRLKYQNYFADDAVNAMLTVVDGLMPAIISPGKKKGLLKPKPCPNCDESNKPESKFCVKCKFVLSFDAFNETVEEADKIKKELAEIKAQQQLQQQQQREERERQRVNQQEIMEKVNRLYETIMSEKEPHFMEIEDEKERERAHQNEKAAILFHGSDVFREMEQEEREEEEAAKRAAAERTDDPLSNDIDYTSDFLDIEEEEQEEV